MLLFSCYSFFTTQNKMYRKNFMIQRLAKSSKPVRGFPKSCQSNKYKVQYGQMIPASSLNLNYSCRFLTSGTFFLSLQMSEHGNLCQRVVVWISEHMKAAVRKPIGNNWRCTNQVFGNAELAEQLILLCEVDNRELLRFFLKLPETSSQTFQKRTRNGSVQKLASSFSSHYCQDQFFFFFFERLSMVYLNILRTAQFPKRQRNVTKSLHKETCYK